MNKRALEEYALFARHELEIQIALSLNKLGIYKDKILKANIVGDFTIIEGAQETYPKRVYHLRNQILNGLKLKESNFEQIVEEFAYTWFNRIIAIRFMEVHDYFDHGFRVLTSSDGSYEPDILKNAHYLIDELDLDIDVILSLKEQNKIEELYRYLLFKQCNALNSILPDMFDNEAVYYELLLPNNLLSNDSVIRKIEIIPEEDFKNDVEIVGWLYQFYNSLKKDAVFASGEIITKDTLPAVTQLFTPDWIVRYMAENSVGRIWLESYPQSSLRHDMKYYIEDASQSNEIVGKLETISYKNVNPEKIKIIEPCCGSGHILVYIFDLLYKMYKEKNYIEKDIPALILKNNLYGLDIDKRASQLAKFSLIMKARSIDNKFFSSHRYVKPRVFEIIDSSTLVEIDYKDNMKSLHFSRKSIEIAEYLINTFKCAKTIGSLLKVERKDYNELLDDIKRCRNNEVPNLLEQAFFEHGLKELKKLVVLAVTLGKKYDVMITNPPYQASGNMEELSKEYLAYNYKDTKLDMYAMFMDVDFVKENGFRAMINQHQWMFASSFVEFRKKFLKSYYLVNVLHLGARAFEELSGEKVQSCAFVARYSSLSFKAKYFRLVDFKHPYLKISEFENSIITNENVYTCDYSKFSKISGIPIAYWISNNLSKTFNHKVLEDYAYVGKGLDTCDQDKFERLWFEVDINKVSFNGYLNNKKWFIFSKGGGYRRWYGNLLDVVDWSNNGYAIRNFRNEKGKIKSRPQNIDKYFKKCVTWSSVGTGAFGARIIENSVFGNGSAMFPDDDEINIPIMALLNSNITKMYLEFLSPGLSFNAGDLMRIPVLNEVFNSKEIISLVNENIRISKMDWSNNEIAWEFNKNPLIKYECKRIKDCYDKYLEETSCWYNSIKSNEEKINSILLNIYELKDEISSNVSDAEISIKIPTIEEAIKDLLSYFIGVLMGRFSLENDDFICSNNEYDIKSINDLLDEDGILPIYKFVGIENGLTNEICKLIKMFYGETYYLENLDFVANGLNRKPSEGAIDAINRYLNEYFYIDHLQKYRTKNSGPRPIYWMLSSGKQGAFKCLIYIHRYNKNTLAVINSKYFLPRTAMYKAERERLEFKLKTADLRNKKKIELEIAKIEACEQELLEYGQVLDHMANQYIELDLDDGVKTNYVKFQNISLEINGATIKKNLLVPFGLEDEKKKK